MLTPPYTFEVRGPRVLIVPALAQGCYSPPRQALAEVMPYDDRNGTAAQRAAAIASRINWHAQLVETVRDMEREFALSEARHSPAQRALLAQARELLRKVG